MSIEEKSTEKKQELGESYIKIILEKLEELDWKLNQILPKPKN